MILRTVKKLYVAPQVELCCYIHGDFLRIAGTNFFTTLYLTWWTRFFLSWIFIFPFIYSCSVFELWLYKMHKITKKMYHNLFIQLLGWQTKVVSFVILSCVLTVYVLWLVTAFWGMHSLLIQCWRLEPKPCDNSYCSLLFVVICNPL